MSAQGIPLTSILGSEQGSTTYPSRVSMDLRQKEIADGRTTVMLAGGPQHANPMGTRYCRSGNGMAFASTLAPEESFTTVELKLNFSRPIWQAQLRAEGTVVVQHHRPC